MPRVQVAKNPVKTQLACTIYSCGFCCRFCRLYFIDRDRDYIFGSQVSLTFISAFYHLSNLFSFLVLFFTFLEEISLGVNYALRCEKEQRTVLCSQQLSFLHIPYRRASFLSFSSTHLQYRFHKNLSTCFTF